MKTPGTVNRIKRHVGLILVLVLMASFTMTAPSQQAVFGSFIVRGSDLEAVTRLVSAHGG